MHPLGVIIISPAARKRRGKSIPRQFIISSPHSSVCACEEKRRGMMPLTECDALVFVCSANEIRVWRKPTELKGWKRRCLSSLMLHLLGVCARSLSAQTKRKVCSPPGALWNNRGPSVFATIRRRNPLCTRKYRSLCGLLSHSLTMRSIPPRKCALA